MKESHGGDNNGDDDEKRFEIKIIEIAAISSFFFFQSLEQDHLYAIQGAFSILDAIYDFSSVKKELPPKKYMMWRL